MHNIRVLALGVATAALVSGSFAAPVSAAGGKGSIAIVHGRPGPKLDFCIGRTKIKRNVSYGGTVVRNRLPQGKKVLKAFKANGKAKCGGTRVARRAFDLGDGEDLTFVVTRIAPKVIVYDNLSTIGGNVQGVGERVGNHHMLTRTADDLGGVNIDVIWYEPFEMPHAPTAPAVDPVWQKGDSGDFDIGPGWDWSAWATFPQRSKRIATAKREALFHGFRYEWYFIGTTSKNAKWTKIKRRWYVAVTG